MRMHVAQYSKKQYIISDSVFFSNYQLTIFSFSKIYANMYLDKSRKFINYCNFVTSNTNNVVQESV